MPRASAADAAVTAARILEAARRHFAREGWAAASLDLIARDATVTRGAVYHHFDGKLGLFRAVVEALQREVGARVLEAAEKERDAAAALRAGSHAFLDAITRDDAARILLVDAPAAVGWQEWRRLDAENSARSLREGLAEIGAVAPDLLDATTQLLSGAMNDAALWVAEGGQDAAGRAAAAHDALDRLLDAVTAPTPRRRAPRVRR